MLVFAAIFSLTCAVTFRGGLLLRSLGIALVTRTGLDASRLRLLWRAIVAWSPVLLALILFLSFKGFATRFSWVVVPMIAIVVWSALRRDRGLHDQLAGTWPVPR